MEGLPLLRELAVRALEPLLVLVPDLREAILVQGLLRRQLLRGGGGL
eukprot:CAMPEP_0183576204 /NCGR_PEP_ID=MMETSP0371-20130417/137153_1 /TAXON_ID=268820 /ORGANISM="Peridinium aciculiferum, Strain PAER-2" /LENGTH=46 /DNA_ID= /DNA_START= /DNA_END= /DNA_ORIENTATION=